MPKEKKIESPLAQRILKLRKSLGMNQISFAQFVRVDQGTISKWESGKARPTPEALMLLSRAAPGIDKLYFWEEAGIPEQFLDGAQMLPEMKAAATRAVARSFSNERFETDLIPLLKDPIAAGNALVVDEREILDHIPFPRRSLPRGNRLFAFRVRGDSMAPIVDEGYIVIIDVSEQDPKKLIGRMVAAREGDGVTIKWLRRDKGVYLLVPQHVSLRIPVRIMREDDDWAIVGVVLGWIGFPPPVRK